VASPQDSKSIMFKCQPFQDFVHKKFKEMMVKENMQQLVQTREEVLNLRHKTEQKNIKLLFIKN
jgi:hypothetical protein